MTARPEGGGLVNQERIWRRLEELAKHGVTPVGGFTRPAFSAHDRSATDLVSSWLLPLGYVPHLDSGGSTSWRLPGAGGPSVLVGSHLDAVPEGGRFDGAAGIVAAVEMVEVFHETGLQGHAPIEVIAFGDEEGSRFPGGLLGSQAVRGLLPDALLTGLTDASGVTLEEALKEFGVKNPSLQGARRPSDSHLAYFELHIEQGTMLEAAGLPVGVVTAVSGITQLDVTLTGRAGHAGATPMKGRKDPLSVAARLVTFVEELALDSAGELRGTVGALSVNPGAANVIPASAEFTVDFRSPSEEALGAAVSAFREAAERLSSERGIEHNVTVSLNAAPVPLDYGLRTHLQATAADLDIPHMALSSGAGHDAMFMQGLCGAAMIFVRSKDGLSHCKEEYSSPEDIALGTELLLHGVAHAAGVDPGDLLAAKRV